MNFKDIYDEIVTNKENHDKGYYNCIPFEGLDRLEAILPGIERATYYLLTSGTGVGKSKLIRYLFIHQPYEYLRNNPDADIKLDILYFSLEESKKKIILSEISKYLFSKYGLVLNIKDLQSVGRYNTISSEDLEKIKEAEEYVTDFLSKVRIYTNTRNPTGIYKKVRDFALEIGTYYTEDNTPLTPKEVESIKTGKGDSYKKIKYYKTYHPRHYVIVIVDHISLLTPETHLGRSLDLRQTMNLFSSEYCLHMRDKFGFIPVIVQQQMATKEAIEVNFKGDTIEQKLEPSLDGLGDSKNVSRDVNIALGLFAPNRFGIKEHSGYNITKLKDNYRSLLLLKNRDGESNLKVPLFFNGATDYFKILPRPDDLEGMNSVYNYISKLNQNKKEMNGK